MMDTEWLLGRIKWLEELNRPNRLPTHRNIWAGSYDVWNCEQDRLDAIYSPSHYTRSRTVGFN